jgi:hypothetical protein
MIYLVAEKENLIFATKFIFNAFKVYDIDLYLSSFFDYSRIVSSLSCI